MSTRSRAELKGFFKTNAIPTQSNFEDLIDSALNQTDDGLVRLPSDALTINAAGPEQTLLRFSSVSASGSTPAWLIKQNPANAPTAGLVFQDAGNVANALFVQSGTGNVGVGTLAPAAKLDVQGVGGTNIDLNVNGRLRSNNPTGGLWITDDRFIGGGSGFVGFGGNANNWWLAVLNSGDVGIGTTTPDARLDVQGVGGTNVDLNVGGRLRSNNPNGGLWIADGSFVGGFANQNGNQIGFYNGGWQVAVQPNGNVGIGTSTASARLEVAGNLKVSGGAITPSVGNDGNSGITWPSDPFRGSGDSAWIRYHNARGGENGTLEIGISNDGADDIFLNPSGNVGISMPAPTSKLHVAGDIASTGSVMAGGKLMVGSWSLETDGVHLFIRHGIYTVARFSSTGSDRFNVFANANGAAPYFFYNVTQGFNTWNNTPGAAPPY